MRAHFDRRFAEVQGLRNLCERKILKPMHHNRYSLALGKLGQRVLDRPLQALVSCFETAFIREFGRKLTGLGEFLAPPAEGVARRIGRDRIKPWFEASFAIEPAAGPYHRQKGGLSQIIRLDRSDQTREVSSDDLSVALKENFESGKVAVAETSHETLVRLVR